MHSALKKINGTSKQAVILVGGKGTRLGALSEYTPKPMLKIGGRPFLLFLIDEVERYGYQDIVLLCGHLAERIYSVFDGLAVRKARVRCVVEPSPMGTGGALLYASYLLDDCFLMLNGDSLFDFNLLDLSAVASYEDWLGKVALRSMPDTGRYGAVIMAGNHVTSFAEKSNNGPGLINGGVYILRRDVLGYIEKTPCSLEQDVLPRIAEQGRLYGRAYGGYFIDIGIPEDLRRAQAELPNRQRPTIFFDRDGVLNHDKGYTYRIEDFSWMEGAIDAIKLFNDHGWLVIVATNQAGIARGYYESKAVENLHAWMQNQLRAKGAHIDAFYYCPHHPDGSEPTYTISCDCRKPAPGMLMTAFAEWPIDRTRSVMIGDKPSDIEAAHRAGIQGISFDGSVGLLQLVTRIVGG